MLKSVKIPWKLGLSFLIICVSAAVMMAVFFSNLTMIRTSTVRNNLSQAIHAQTLTLETALLRQNSQMRGFLVTADPTYLKSYGDARDEYDKTSVELEKAVPEPAHREAVQESRAATLAWRKAWGDRLIALVKAGQREAAQDQVRSAGKAVLVSDAVLPLRTIRDDAAKQIEQNSARQASAIGTATTVLVVGGIALIVIAITMAFLLSRLIAKPILGLTTTMASLTAGHNDVAVPDTDRRDEIGDIARAVLIFRDAAVAKAAADADREATNATVQMVVRTLGASLSELSNRDLTTSVSADFPGVYGVLKENYNEALTSLRTTIEQVSETAAAISTGSDEIAQATEDLARRTESNAASLEETSAALVQIESRLKATATASLSTVERADHAMETVDTGRTIAESAKGAMGRVSGSAKGIDDVIEGLDKIAFQTRVLAMNAAVEAGRAGEAGRGFAVVADLVSALAMRAEEEARRARDQLSVTQSEIVSAVDAVSEVDSALVAISHDVAEVNKLLATMAADHQAQSSAVTEITAAISMMDRATQQNAAMVEQTSAAARNLTQEVGNLASAAAQFNITSSGRRAAGGRPNVGSPASAQIASMLRPAAKAKVLSAVGSGRDNAHADAGNDWSAF